MRISTFANALLEKGQDAGQVLDAVITLADVEQREREERRASAGRRQAAATAVPQAKAAVTVLKPFPNACRGRGAGRSRRKAKPGGSTSKRRPGNFQKLIETKLLRGLTQRPHILAKLTNLCLGYF